MAFELSHQLDGTLRVYRSGQLLFTRVLPLQEHIDRRPAPISNAQKPKLPRIYNLFGRRCRGRYSTNTG